MLPTNKPAAAATTMPTKERSLPTREALEATPWAREFKADSPVSYEQALTLVMAPDLTVWLVHNCDVGIWQWSIVADELAPGFWLDAKPTKKAALALCRQMGWPVENPDVGRNSAYTPR